MFGMLSVLAELQRELILANTRDGLAAARARGRKGGRRPRLNTEQVALAQQLYDAGDHTVQQSRPLQRAPHHRLRAPRQRKQREAPGHSPQTEEPRRRTSPLRRPPPPVGLDANGGW
jgi:hypothetical protein